MIIGVGSTNLTKIAAVSQAIQLLGKEAIVIGVDTPSGVPMQPLSTAQIFTGAENRARSVAKDFAHAYMTIGIENGIVIHGTEAFDQSAVCVFQKTTNGFWNKKTEVMSRTVPIPWAIVEETVNTGLNKITFGMVLAKRGKIPDHTDPHSFLTGGKFSRVDILTDAVSKALEEVCL